MRLFHAGYIDRPRAQLDYYPTFGSAPMIYALADRGVRLLKEWDGAEFRNPEWSRKNREAGRPFIWNSPFGGQAPHPHGPCLSGPLSPTDKRMGAIHGQGRRMKFLSPDLG